MRDLDVVRIEKRANLKLRHPHPDAQGLRFVRASHDTAVIVRQDDNRLTLELGVKHSFAGCVEVVAIDEGQDWRHRTLQRVNDVGDDAPDFKLLLRLNLDRLVVSVLREQAHGGAPFGETLHGEFAIQRRDDRIAIDRFKGPIHEVQSCLWAMTDWLLYRTSDSPLCDSRYGKLHAGKLPFMREMVLASPYAWLGWV